MGRFNQGKENILNLPENFISFAYTNQVVTPTLGEFVQEDPDGIWFNRRSSWTYEVFANKTSLFNFFLLHFKIIVLKKIFVFKKEKKFGLSKL